MKDETHQFVLITPCFNEEKYLNYSLKSVIAQTRLPLKWIIVDDGSTDNSLDLIEKHKNLCDWIEYYYKEKNEEDTYYSSSVNAILYGIEQVSQLNYSFIAILDADIELCLDYFEKIFDQFEKFPELGIVTGIYMEKIDEEYWADVKISRMSTPKAIQVFRKDCYDQCGGYIPFKYGGEDSSIEVLARMHGWQTWSFENIKVKHHRSAGTGDGRTLLKARVRLGITDYCVGSHPIFMLAKGIKRMVTEKPFIVSGLARLYGYLHGSLNRYEKQMPVEGINYLRKEQLSRLFKPWTKRWRPL